VGGSGAMDGPALRAANLLVGNAAGAAGLECTIAGPRLRFLAATHFALTGGDLSAVLHRDDLGAWPVPRAARVLARAGNVLVADGMVPGCVQVPPDGQPIVMMAGGPVTGGYPKIATVVGADLPALAQLVPGEGRLRFRAVSVEEAQEAIGDASDL